MIVLGLKRDEKRLGVRTYLMKKVKFSCFNAQYQSLMNWF